MSAPKRRKKFKDRTTPGERAWLTGEGVDDLTAMDRWMYDQLSAGHTSYFNGRQRTPEQLLEQFGAMRETQHGI